MKPLIAGNWKMNGLAASLGEIDELLRLLGGKPPAAADVLVCPPATILAAAATRLGGSGVFAGGQDCHPDAGGAHTGDISAEMLKDAGAAFVIVGHSERRADHGETDALVNAKAGAARRAGLTPLICVGETRAEREAGKAEAVVGTQLDGSLPGSGEMVVAYEPVWAIGTGLTPTTAEIAAMHGFIRNRVGSQVRILYGGSVKPSNAAEILAIDNVDGALVGGACLKAADFHAIIKAV
ncbi:MAG: triose-phosphate isomerase [Pseudomonadota bacterium]|nr:triose-phosphate isomerase [Pseudomonadota bacterium]